LRAIERPTVPGVRWTTPDQWHVTLRFLGPVDDPEEGKRALERIKAVGPVTARAGPALVRLSRFILCLPVEGLADLAAAVVRATRKVGQPPDRRPFHGHVTVARARQGADVGPLAGRRLAGEWPVDEVTLVASQLLPAGSRYTVLARYPVR
jgi:2'-5' RNA ligase